jgi:hypothetical protein
MLERMAAQSRYDEIAADLAARGVQSGKMFGMPTLKADGKAIAGLTDDGMVFKLPDPAVRERALALDGAHLFEPMAGRQMKEWVVVPQAHAKQWLSLAETALTLRASP